MSVEPDPQVVAGLDAWRSLGAAPAAAVARRRPRSTR